MVCVREVITSSSCGLVRRLEAGEGVCVWVVCVF